MLPALREQAPEVEWQIRESEYDGRYISGHRGAWRFRIVDYGERKECEAWYSGESEPVERYVEEKILPAVAAVGIRRE
jgi:hypothetical protein